jgi:hypothetical protein
LTWVRAAATDANTHPAVINAAKRERRRDKLRYFGFVAAHGGGEQRFIADTRK